MNSIYNNVDTDEIQKVNTMEALNNIAESHSIKDLLLKKRADNQPLENVSKARREEDNSEDNSDATFKISNFL